MVITSVSAARRARGKEQRAPGCVRFFRARAATWTRLACTGPTATARARTGTAGRSPEAAQRGEVDACTAQEPARRQSRSVAGSGAERRGQLAMLLGLARTASCRAGRSHVTRSCCRQTGSSSSAVLSSGESPEERLHAVLRRLDTKALPPAPQPGGLYVPAVQHGNLLYVSGHVPYDAEGKGIAGVAASDDDIPRTKLAAAHNALSVLATVRSTLGSLNRVKRLVKSFCMVNCTNDFGAHPIVMNGYSEVMAEVRVLGESTLPFTWPSQPATCAPGPPIPLEACPRARAGIRPGMRRGRTQRRWDVAARGDGHRSRMHL